MIGFNDDFTKELLNSKDCKKYVKENIDNFDYESVNEYIIRYIEENNLAKSDVIKSSNLDKNYAYQIFNGNKIHPSRDKVIMMAYGMKMNLQQTSYLLCKFQVGELFVRNMRDSVIIYCINHHKNLLETNDILGDLNLDILE